MFPWDPQLKQQTCQKSYGHCLLILLQNCLIECFGNTNHQLYKAICPRTWKFPDGFHNKMCWVIKSYELLSHMAACWACTKLSIMEHQQLSCQFSAITTRIQKKQKLTVMVRVYSNLFKTSIFFSYFILCTALKLHLETLTSEKLLKSIHAVIHDSKYRREAKWVSVKSCKPDVFRVDAKNYKTLL